MNCINCDHSEACHNEDAGCHRIVQGNIECACHNYKPNIEAPITQTAPQVVITLDADLKYMQEMVQRMMFNQKLTD